MEHLVSFPSPITKFRIFCRLPFLYLSFHPPLFPYLLPSSSCFLPTITAGFLPILAILFLLHRMTAEGAIKA